MDRTIAEERFAEVGVGRGPSPDFTVDQYAYSGVGRRAGKIEFELVRNKIVELATEYGFVLRHGFDQDVDPGDHGRAAFDRGLFRHLHGLMPMNWSEAGSREVWSWCALALVPDVTHWRWNWAGNRAGWNRERWIATDLTRHTWARQWWRAVQFAEDPELIERILESEFNQLTERADTLGTSPDVLTAFARKYRTVRSPNQPKWNRLLIRDSAQRILRDMAYIDPSVLGGFDVVKWVDRRVSEAVTALTNESEPDGGAPDFYQ